MSLPYMLSSWPGQVFFAFLLAFLGFWWFFFGHFRLLYHAMRYGCVQTRSSRSCCSTGCDASKYLCCRFWSRFLRLALGLGLRWAAFEYQNGQQVWWNKFRLSSNASRFSNCLNSDHDADLPSAVSLVHACIEVCLRVLHIPASTSREHLANRLLCFRTSVSETPCTSSRCSRAGRLLRPSCTCGV